MMAGRERRRVSTARPTIAPTLATFESEIDPAVVARIATRILGLTPEADLGN